MEDRIRVMGQWNFVAPDARESGNSQHCNYTAYTRKTTEATHLLDLETEEEWYK